MPYITYVRVCEQRIFSYDFLKRRTSNERRNKINWPMPPIKGENFSFGDIESNVLPRFYT